MVSQRRIGLTGGIASGKSTVGGYLNSCYGLPILDADRYAKEALQGEILDRIILRFGEIILKAGRIDRTALGMIVFQDQKERRWLEAQIHPFVRQQLASQAQAYFPKTLVLEVPLLFEAEMTDLVSEIWVVFCSEDTTRQRLQIRNQFSWAEANARIAAQMPIAQKCNLADVVIRNEGSLAELYQQVDQIMGRS